MSASLNKKYSWEKKKKEQTPHQHQTPRPEEEILRTSSPTLIGFPPQPGKSTLSPALTDGDTTFPALSRAPGPTAITVASGSGVDVDDEGK